MCCPTLGVMSMQLLLSLITLNLATFFSCKQLNMNFATAAAEGTGVPGDGRSEVKQFGAPVLPVRAGVMTA